MSTALVSRFGGQRSRSKPRVSLTGPRAKANKRPGESRTAWLRFGGWTLALVFASILTLVLSLACLVGFRWATTSPFFAVSEITVSGNSRLDRETILERADLYNGLNIFEVEIGAVERRLAADPWIERAMVTRVLPGRLEITVTERKPAYWKLAEGRLLYADSDGALIAPVESEKFDSLPLLIEEEGAGEQAGLIERLSVAGLPVDPGRAQWINARGYEEISMYFDEIDMTIALDPDELARGAKLIARAWKDLERRGELARVKSMKAMDGRVWVGMR